MMKMLEWLFLFCLSGTALLSNRLERELLERIMLSEFFLFKTKVAFHTLEAQQQQQQK